MSKELAEPFMRSDRYHNDIESDGNNLIELDDTSSVESSPLVNKTQPLPISERPKDLSFLASANFSTDSIAEVDEDIQYGVYNESPSTPNHSSSIFNYPNGNHGRRLSISSLNSPSSLMRPPTNSKPRPRSAFYPDESFRFDDSPYAYPNSSNVSSALQSPVNQGRQNHRRNIPPPIIAPPYSSRSGSPTRSASPTRANRHFRSKSPVRRGSSPTKLYQPFNFQSQEVMLNNGNGATLTVKPAHRKGHKYKHSSVSMNYFQEPKAASLDTEYSLVIPVLYPIPTFKESLASITSNQKTKIYWCTLHLLLSLIVFLSGHKLQVPELSTLAHLIFYDSLGCMVIVLVQIMSNFEVWKHPSITYPFGLGRLEVLIGFALAASLIMVGFDLLSHIFEEFIIMKFAISDEHEGHHGGGSHHVHRADGTTTGSLIYYFVLIFTVVVTLITSNYILTAEKINKLIKDFPTHNRNISNIGYLDEGSLKEPSMGNKAWEKLDRFADSVTKNPTYILTLLYSTYLMLSPVISEMILQQFEIDINEIASLVISVLFCLTGWKLVRALGGVLLISYPGSPYTYEKLKLSILNEINQLEMFKSNYTVDTLFITKCNYEVFIVGVKVIMIGGSVDNESAIRFEISRIIKRKIENRQRGNITLETTIDIDRT